MTSELRPAVGVWREASDAATLGSVKYKPAADQAAAAVIEAYGDEREAKGREEQAREIERLRGALGFAMRTLEAEGFSDDGPTLNRIRAALAGGSHDQ